MSTPIIQKLPDDLINKIAAGEVVERPASVIKELIENSLDAGSTQIEIDIKDGGKKLIQIRDNGHGIAPDQLELAISRHATSKISSFEDLYNLHTKGFRGEALASITSVAQVNIASKTSEFDACEINIENGQIIEKKVCAHPQGTTVSVKYLFYQTPARLKFLKTKETETSHIVDVVTKMALCHSHVNFTLTQNDRTLFQSLTQESEKDRVIKILGRDLQDYLYEFSGETKDMKVRGYLSHPQVSRSQRNSIHLFVNDRPVQDKVLWHAILESYRDLLMKGKFPVIVLHLQIKEDQIDVNVHPSKSEVRFHYSQLVHSFIYQTLRKKLQEAPWLQSQSSDNKEKTLYPHLPDPLPQGERVNTEKQNENSVQSSLKNWSQKFYNASINEPQKEYSSTKESQPNLGFSQISSSSQNSDSITTFKKTKDLGEQRQIQFGKTPYANMHVIGQFLGTYILCESEGKLILIDQHAAHERVGFEKLLLQMQKDGVQSEPLLIPETFDLSPSDCDILKNYLEELSFYGFEIDFFGGNTFVLKSQPGLLKNKIKITALMADLIADIKETGALTSLKDKYHHILATMSCHAQIRAHHLLNKEEIHALLKELEEYQFTDFCPHGRPVSVEITKDEIEKWFKRVL